MASPAAAQDVEPAVAAAEAWLAGQQRANGSYGAFDELSPRDTARVVLALAGREASDEQVTRGAIYLAGVPEASAEFRALRVLALASSGRPASNLRDSLLGFQNGGGYGAFAGHQSNLFDSALAVQALQGEETRFLFEISSLLDYVQMHQAPDGGWGLLPGAGSELYYSAEVLDALAGLDELSVGSGVLDAAAAFLLARQQADGGFGGVLETAVAYRALLAADRDPASYPNGSPVPYLLAQQAVDGSWSGEPFTTAQVLRVLRGQKANLVIQELSAPTNTAPGHPILVSITVKNTGVETAPATELELRADAVDGELLAAGEIVELASGEEFVLELEVATDGLTGNLDIFAIADAADAVEEADEDDNVESVRVTLRAGPDLALFAEDLALGTDPPSPGEAFDLLVSVRNLGETGVDDFAYEVSRRVDGAPNEIIASGNTGPVDAGAGLLLPVSLTLAEGEHSLTVTLDPANVVDEENEANNETSLSFFVVDGDQADLAVADADFTLNPAEPNGGEMVDVTVTVHNHGQREATSDLVLLESSSDAGGLGGGVELRRLPLTLAPETSQTFTETLPLGLGAFALTAVVDVDGLVPETDETNNRSRRIFRDLPDLAIGFDNFEILTPDPLAGDPVTFQLTVRNAGTLEAIDVPVEVFEGDPGAGGVSVYSSVLPLIPAAGNRSVSFTWTASEGLQTLFAVADSGDTIVEFSEDNNRFEREVAVPRASGPDLEITAVDTSALAQSETDLSMSGFVTLDVANSGDTATATSFLVRIFEDRDGDGRFDLTDVSLGVAVVEDPLAAGAGTQVQVDIDTTTSFFHPLAWAEVDAGDALAEMREDNNRAHLLGACRSAAPEADASAPFEPIEEWYLGDVEIESTPIVVQVTDDNGDGLIDSRDVPDVVFHTSDSEGSAIVAVSGLDGSRHWTFRASSAYPVLDFLGQVAAADLDGDGVVEIVGHQTNRRLIALRHDGSLLWVSDQVPGVGGRGLGGPAIGDLDSDGVPEIAYGRAVLSNVGELIAVGTGNTGQNYNRYGLFGTVLPPGVGSYPQSIIADVDLDGRNELVAGDTLYRLNGSDLEIVWNATVPDGLMVDGFSAVANFDGDPEAEIVYVSSNQIMVLNHDGSTFAGRRLMVPFSTFEMPTYWGGPPTVADLDGDGTSEILVVTATRLFAFSPGLGVRWQRSIQADFGGFHTTTAFDFEGDGVREVLMMTEGTFYVLDGATGATRYSRSNISKTAMEHAAVADVDGDGRAEILLPSNTSFSGNSSTRGLHVLGHPSWRGTRPMWNQYGYHVTNVALDGTVPSPQQPPWSFDNIYRGNRATSPPAELLRPNASAGFPRVGAGGPDGIPITVRVGNGGLAPLPAGVPVEIYAGSVATGSPIVAASTSRGLLPGEWEDVVLYWTVPSDGSEPVVAVVDGAATVDECDESDNEVAFELTETLLPDLGIPSGGVTAPSPVPAGQLVDVEVRVVNVGNARADATVVRFFDGPPASGDLLGELPVPALAAGEEAQIVFEWDTFGSSGLRLVHVVVDPDSTLLELSLENNAGLVEIELLPAALPDLTVETFTASPSTVDAGTPVLLTADVRNLGSRAEGGVTVRFRANNSVVGTATVPGALEAGDVRTLQIELATQSYSGTVGLRATVDPDGVLAESNEGNNETTATLIVQPRAVTAAVSLERLSYGPEETVAADVTLRNLGSEDREVDLVVQLVDSLGVVAAQFDQQTLVLVAGQTTVLNIQGSTGQLPAGSYSVVAEVAKDGVLLTRGSALLTLTGAEAASASLLTDRDVYTPLQSAVLEGTVTNLSANTPLVGATARLAVTGAGGTEVYSLERSLTSIFPSSSVPVNGIWDIAGASPGAYTASLSLRDDSATLVAYVERPLVVESSNNTGAGLEGSLTLPLDEIALGAPFVADFEVQNQGNDDVTDLELRFDLVRTADGEQVDAVSRTLSLARGTSASGSVGFATQGLAEGGYLVSMVAVLPARETRLDRTALTLISGVSVYDATTFEGDSGSHQMTFPVRLSSVQPVEVTVEYATADGSATAGSDYASTSGLLTFAAGETEKSIAVTVFGDVDPETEETFLVSLSNAVGIDVGDGSALGVLVDEEGCASRDLMANGDAEEAGAAGELVGWTAGDGFERRFAAPPPLSGAAYLAVRAGASEGELSQSVDLSPYAAVIDAGLPIFVIDGYVQVAGGDAARLVVEYLDAAGAVLAGYDSGVLTASGGWLSVTDQRVVPAGTRSAKVSVSGSGPGPEVAAYFDRLTLRSAGVTTLTLGSVDIFEGDAGTVIAGLPLGLSCASAVPLAVDVITSDDTARAGSDYSAVATMLTVPAGQDSLTVVVDVVGDTLDEPTETFFVVPSTSDAVVLDPVAVVTILDDDGPVGISVHDLSTPEGDAAGSATVSVSLSAPSGKTVTVNFHTEAGTATGGADYSQHSGQLTFPPGTTEQTLDVSLLGDLLDEPDETFEVVLSAPTNAGLDDARGTVTLVDDDVVQLAANDVSVVEGDPDGADTTVADAVFTVSLSLPSVSAITVDYATADGLGIDPAVVGSDYEPVSGTLTFAPGETQATVSVPIVADLFREPEESFRLVLSMPAGGAGTPVLGDPEGEALILDDDGILISIGDAEVREVPGYPTNLSQLYGAQATPSSNWTNNPAYGKNAIDGRLDTNWYPVRDDAVNRGGSPYFEVTLAAPSRVVGLRLFGNRSPANGYDYFSGIFTLYADDGTVLWETPDTALPAPDRDVIFDFPPIDGVRRARFASTGDQSDHPGLSEFQVIGFSAYHNLSFDEGTTATAVSSYSNSYLPHRVFDGNFNTAWYPRPGDAVNQGGESWFEIHLRGVATVYEIHMYGERNNSGYDYLAGTFQLYDAAGTLLWDSGVVDLPAPSHDAVIPVPAVSGAVRMRFDSVEDENTHPGISELHVWGDYDSDLFVPVTLSKPPITDIGVSYTTVEGSATADEDFVSTTGSLFFPIGSLQRDIPINLLPDDLVEFDETFGVELFDPVEGILLDAEGEVTIHDDDWMALNGSAEMDSVPGCVVLTPDVSRRWGSAWRKDRIDLGQSFDKTFRVHLGTRGSSAGEGMYFALHDNGESALGASLGYMGLAPSVGVQLDTNSGTYDLMSLDTNGIQGNGTTPVHISQGVNNLADGTEHELRVIWNEPHQTLSVEFDGDQRIREQRDYVNDIFGGETSVLWGFTGGTYSRRDLQYFCPTDGWCQPGAEKQLAVADVQRPEGDPAGGPSVMSFPVTLSCPSDEVVTVSYATVDGTAEAGSDYQAVSGQLIFLPGETAKQVEVTVLADVEWEVTETFSLQLSTPAGASLQHGEAIGTIEADDWGTGVTVEQLIEDELNRSYYVVPVDLFVVPTEQVRINYQISGGTATANNDFSAANSYLTFNAGQRVANLRIDIRGDSAVEGDETLHVDFSSSTGLIEPYRVTFTIVDDDECPSPNLLRNPGADEPLVNGELPGWTEVEGDLWTAYRRVGTPDNTTNHFFPGTGLVPYAELRQDVDVSGYSRVIDLGVQTFVFQGHIRVRNETVDSTARIVVEYRDAQGNVLESWDSGESPYKAIWEAVGDERLAPPGTRTIRVRLIGVDYNQVGWNEAYFDTLHLRSLRYPSIVLGDVALEEGDVGERFATVPVSLTCPGELPVEFQYLTADGTATAGIDYRPTSGEVTIPVGADTASISVPVLGDTVVEGDETFQVLAHSPVEAGLGIDQATVTLIEDESRMSIADTEVIESSDGVIYANFTVTLDRPSEADISARYTTHDGTATAGEDYMARSSTVRFFAGSVEEIVTVSVYGDTDEEPDETFFVRLTEPNNVEIDDGEAVGTIIQDDIAISVGNANVLEGNVATTFATFEVELAVPSSTVVSVDWQTVEATATAGEDYQSASGTLVFQPGEIRKSFPVTVYGDELRESSETFFVRLSNPVNGNLRVVEGTGIIIDDDDCPSPNLLLNPSGEIPPSDGDVAYWQEVGSSSWTAGSSSPAPIDGELYFRSGSGNQIELVQQVSVATYAAYVDAGLQRFSFEGFARSRVEADPDVARILVEYLDEAETVLEVHDSGDITSTSVWQPVGDLRLAPVGTRSIRVRLTGRPGPAGGSTQVYFDGLGLRSVGTPVLLPADVEIEEGDETSVTATFGVDLLCPSEERTITLDYATRDRSAVGESDYVEVQGSMTFLPGEDSRTVDVEILGDYKREVLEEFYLDFSNVVNAVVLYPFATGTITDDDPGNAPVPPSFGSDVIYTYDADFELGYLVSVQHDDPADDQLQLSTEGSTFPFIWVAASNRGTIVKIDTRSGEILGEFSTSPDRGVGANPSRTTVMLDGSVWVTNRSGRSIAHVGLIELNQCVDRNGNGTIETSTGYGDVLPWPNRNNEDSAGGVSTAEDECLLHFVPTTASGTRHISVRDENSIWVSGTSGRQFDLVDTNTGEILRTEPAAGCGGYGGLTDRSGVVWSSSPGWLLRWDPSVEPATAESKRCISASAYGVAVDSKGWIWVAQGSTVRKISPDGQTVLGNFPHGNDGSQGLAVDGNDHVWVSSSLGGGNTAIGHLDNDGNLIGRVFGVPDGPTGISVDSRGFIWSANFTDGSASRIDPTKGPIGSDGVTPVGEVDLVVDLPGASPYNYSDMTGFVALQATSRRGTWSVIQDAGAAGAEWGEVSWNAEPQGNVPEGASLVVEVRVADTVVALGSLAWTTVENGVGFEMYGRYLQARVTLRPNAAGDSPVLSDLRIALADEGEVAIGDQTVTEGTGGTTPVDVTVTLVEPALREVVASFTTRDVTAEAGVDYVAATGTVVFQPGTTVTTISLEVIGDDVIEDTETFEVDLFDLFNGVFLDSVGVVTILDDDFAADPELIASKTDALAVDADGDTVPSPGDTVEYMITVENVGDGDATGVVLRDLAPTYTSIVAGSVTTDTGLVLTESPVEVDLGTLAAGQLATVTFRVAIANPFPLGIDEISNQATAESVELPVVLSDDPDVGGDVDPTVTMVTAAPRMVAEKVDALVIDADGDTVPSPGDTLEYTISLRNLGNTAATNVAFGDTTPENTTYVAGSATTSHGTIEADDPLEILIPQIDVGTVATITFRVLVNDPIASGVTQVENQGVVLADGLAYLLTDDPDVQGEADPTVTEITSAPVLTVEKTDSLFTDDNGDGELNPGEELLYRLEIVSSGNTAATQVTVEDVLPAHVTLVTGTVQTDTGSVLTEEPVAVDLGAMVPGTTAVVTFRVLTDDPFPFDVLEIANQAVVASAELDPILSDDPDTEPLADPTVTPVLTPADLSIDDVTVTEGDAGETDAVFTVSLSNATSQPVELTYATDPVGAASAAEDVDYVGVSGTLTIPPGDVTATITVPVIGDLMDEPDETFHLVLTSVSGATVIDDVGLGTILDDDDPPTLFIADVVVTEGDPAAGDPSGGIVPAIFVLTLDQASGFDITAAYQTADVEAVGDLDYETTVDAVLIPAGQTTTSVLVRVLPDLLDEPDETFLLQLSDLQNAVFGDPLAVGTILDGDPPPTATLGDVSVIEGDPVAGAPGLSDALFTLTLSGPSGFDIQMTYATAEGGAHPATEGVDYLAQSDVLVLPAGVETATLAVPVVGDELDELDETFLLTLSDPVYVTIADGEGHGTILDDDEALLGIDDQVVEEGDDGQTDAVFTIDLTVPSDREIQVSYDTREGGSTPATEDEDYADTSGSIVFAPGEQEAQVPVAVYGDRLLEDDETFEVHLTDPVNAGFLDPLGLGTILDDEACLGPNLLANGSGELALVDGELVGWVEVAGADWTYGLFGPAAAYGDAYLVSATDDVAELAQDLDVSGYAARIDDGSQEFELSAFLGQGDFLPPADTRMMVEFRDETNTLVLDHWDSGAPAAVGGWEQAIEDVFAPIGTRWIRVRLLSTASVPGGVGIVSNQGHFDAVSVRSIGAPVVWIDDVTVHEASGIPAVFALHLACPVDGEISTLADTADGSAIAPDDYEATSASIVFPKGETEAELPVPIVQDETPEEPEQFEVDLSQLLGPYGPAYWDAQGVGTILDQRRCPRSPGYWKNHTELWPVQWLRIGGELYDAPDLLEMLQYGGPDASSTLARQLVASKLNLANGADPYIVPTVEAADAFLALFPPGSDPRGADRDEGLAIKDALDAYNNLDCQDPDEGGGGGGGNGNGNGNGNGGNGGNGGGDDDGGVGDGCPRTPGFWKTHHPQSWPVFELQIGDQIYSDAELLVFLGEDASDASLGLTHHLVATKLNLLVGTDPSIQQVIDDADAFLVENPPGSNPNGRDRQDALALKDSLDAYNNGPCP